MIDARAGVTPDDKYFADLVRRAGKPVVLVANKAEGRAGEAGFIEAYTLGLGDPVPLSAEHGEGMIDLFDALRVALPEATEAPIEEDEARATLRVSTTRTAAISTSPSRCASPSSAVPTPESRR